MAPISGGQRLAISHALASRPRILIFDEATSAVDYESEQIIQQNMRQIVQGTHGPLLQRQDGLYANLWRLQQGQTR